MLCASDPASIPNGGITWAPPSIPPFDAPNRQHIAQGHPPDWPPPRRRTGTTRGTEKGVVTFVVPNVNAPNCHR